MKCYSVRDWDKLYETSETRKLKRLTWVPTPNKHDGNGYRRLMSQPDPGNLFAAFRLIVEVASKMPSRGLLEDRDGPLNSQDMAYKTGLSPKHFKRAFDVLSDPQVKICWLDVTGEDNNPLEPQDNPLESAGNADTNRIEVTGIEVTGLENNIPVADATRGVPYGKIKASWNEIAKRLDLPQCRKITGRKPLVRKCWKDPEWQATWEEALTKIEGSAFLRGETGGTFKASIDWFLGKKNGVWNVTKLMEGAYDGQPQKGPMTVTERSLQEWAEEHADDPE